MTTAIASETAAPETAIDFTHSPDVIRAAARCIAKVPGPRGMSIDHVRVDRNSISASNGHILVIFDRLEPVEGPDAIYALSETECKQVARSKSTVQFCDGVVKMGAQTLALSNVNPTFPDFEAYMTDNMVAATSGMFAARYLKLLGDLGALAVPVPVRTKPVKVEMRENRIFFSFDCREYYARGALMAIDPR